MHTLYRKTGILVFNKEHGRSVAHSLKVNKIPHQRLRAEEVSMNGYNQNQLCACELTFLSQVNGRYSKQLCFPANTECVFEEDGGILMATKAVAAYQVKLQSNCNFGNFRCQN